MRNKLLSGILCVALMLGLATPAFAAGARVSETEAAQVLAALDIMTGDERGDLQLDRAVTRAEFVKLTIAASVYADSVGGVASVSPYPDVAKSAWYASYVQVAKEKELVRGNTRGQFEPGRNITLVEGVTLALRLLSYQDSDFSGAWGAGQMAMYSALDLDRGISIGRNDAMTRRDTLWLFYNLLTAKDKGGKAYLMNLGHSLTPAGEIDRVALINAAMEGPVVAQAGWQASLPFDIGLAKVYRGGNTVTAAAIQSTDLVYWSKPMKTLWVYSDRVTGTIERLAPNASAPTSITLGGQTYAIETAAAAYDLSDLGLFRVGDGVTLLLGRSGGVAAVRTPGQSEGIVYGMVTATGTGSYQDASGKSYAAGNVTITATDGNSYTYQWENKNRTFEPGDLVQITLSASGTDIKKLSKTPLTGKITADAKKIGNYTLADDVQILDTYGKTTAARVYPARLAGVNLTGEMVSHYVLNAQGEVSRLILRDVTGDLHQYGVLTKVDEVSMGMTLMASYVYDIAGIPGMHTSDKAIWNLKEGPAQIKTDSQKVERIYNLTELKLTAVSGNKAIAGDREYTLADGIAVYELRDGTYYLTDLSRIAGGGYTLTGWQDKAETEGGLIRVLVAKAQ